MKLQRTKRFAKSYASAPEAICRAAEKQLRLLMADLSHPSLRAKKYDEGHDIWQARINRDWRLYFQIRGNCYVLLEMSKHPK